MSCQCQSQAANVAAAAHVTDFSAAGFTDDDAVAMPSFDGIQAALIKFCAAASVDSSGKVCFKAPVFGPICVKLPIPIPVNADIKACGETCGSFIPTGLKVTIYLNGSPVFTKVVVGSC